MKSTLHPCIVALLLSPVALLLNGCSTSTVTEARASGVDRRQDRVDARTTARQDRWAERAEREDARVQRRMDSW